VLKHFMHEIYVASAKVRQSYREIPRNCAFIRKILKLHI
jgi:hypothetical protein